MLYPPDKDPDEVLRYVVDWAPDLGTDTISSSAWVMPSGITKDSDSNDTTSTTIWISGGTSGSRYVIVNRVITAAGETLEQSLALNVSSTETGLVTLGRVKQALRIDTADDDALLRFLILAASRSVVRYLKGQAGPVLGIDSPPEGAVLTGLDYVPEDVSVATMLLVGHLYRNPDNDKEGAFEQGYLPKPITALLYPLRDPAIA